MQQRTPQWHAARLGHITGSRCAPLHVSGRKGTWGVGAVTLMRQLVGELLTRRPAGFRPVWMVDEFGWSSPNAAVTHIERLCEMGYLIRERRGKTSSYRVPAATVTIDWGWSP